MKLTALAASLMIVIALPACSTAMTKMEANPWLEQRIGFPNHDISGRWETGSSWSGNWGEANFIQDGARFYGELGSYTVDGVQNGDSLYLALSSGRKVYYTALLKREANGSYAGKVAKDTLIDGEGAANEGYQVMILNRPKAATNPAPKPAASGPMRAL